MPFFFEIGAFYLVILIFAPKLAKKIATIIGAIIFAFVMFYFSEKYNAGIQSWQPYIIFGLTLIPTIIVWVRYYGSK